MWIPTAAVFVGGGLGAITRELSMLTLDRYSAAFPVDIFAANIIASLLLGAVYGLQRRSALSDEAMLLIGTGFCGGMSTFSTFIFGSYSEMLTPGQFGLAILYVISSLVVGYGATWFGISVATRLRRAAV